MSDVPAEPPVIEYAPLPGVGQTMTTYDLRLAALDRAINRLNADRTAGAEDVVAMAETFEAYLTRPEESVDGP